MSKRTEYESLWEQRVAELSKELSSLYTRAGNVVDAAYEKLHAQWTVAKDRLAHFRSGGSDKGGPLPDDAEKAWEAVEAAPGPAQHELPPERIDEPTTTAPSYPKPGTIPATPKAAPMGPLAETSASTRITSRGFAAVVPEDGPLEPKPS